MRSGSGRHSNLKSLALLLALVAATVLVPSFDSAQKSRKPLSADEIVNLLTGDVPSSEVGREAQDAGISFQMTPDVVRRIRDAGGTESLISTLRSLAPRESTPVTPPPRPVTPSAPPTLVVNSSPGQCQVYVDDSPVGSTSEQGRLRLTHLAPG